MSGADLVRKLRARSWAERLMLVQAVAALAIMRLGLRLPFRTLSRAVGLHAGQAPDAGEPDNVEYAEHVGRAVRSVAAHTPWPSTCLVQALAAAAILRLRGVDSTLYLGVTNDAAAPNGVAAHAWLRCGGLVLTGGAGREGFEVIAQFTNADGDEPRLTAAPLVRTM
jgi:hypothetical protein